MALAKRSPTQLTLKVHPDSTYDRPYETVTVDVSGYTPLAGPFTCRQIPGGFEAAAGKHARIRVDVCTESVIRIRCLPGSADFAPSVTERLGLISIPAEDVRTTTKETRTSWEIRTPVLRFVLDKASGGFQVFGPESQPLIRTRPQGIRFSPEPGEYSGNRFLAAFDLRDEQIFGFGGRNARPNRTGATADIFAVKVGSHSGDYGGFPIPYFLSTLGYGVFLNNPWPHVYFDMGNACPDEWSVHAPGGAFDLFVIHGPEFADIVRRLTDIVGRIPPPQRWWLGFWTSTIAFNTADQVREHMRIMREDRCPHDVIVLDGPWRGGPDFFDRYTSTGQYASRDIDWHPEFRGGPDFIREMDKEQLRLGLHLNSRSFGKETADDAVAKGLLRRHGEEVVPRVGDPAGEAWFQKFIRERNAEGVGVWWLDHGDRVSGEISPGIPSRNLFGALWARAVLQANPDKPLPAHICLSRGIGIGGQKYGLPWPGDTRYGVEFFEEDIWFCINAGLSGFPLTSYDVGGFFGANAEAAFSNTAHDEDNLARRVCQSALFSPTLRAHCNGVHPMKIPANCPPRIRALYLDLLRLRYRLTPYFFSYAVHAHRTGEPIVRPLVYHHRMDPRTHDLHDQVYVGDWLLVAPVVQKGARHRNVYLPEGRWIDFWTGEVHKGGQTLRVDAPLYEMRGLPVYVRAGAIIPLQNATTRLPDVPPAHLTLEVYPHGSTEFVLWDSPAQRSVFRCRARGRQIDIAAEQDPSLRRTLAFRLHGVAPGVRVRYNGRAVALKKGTGISGVAALEFRAPR